MNKIYILQLGCICGFRHDGFFSDKEKCKRYQEILSITEPYEESEILEFEVDRVRDIMYGIQIESDDADQNAIRRVSDIQPNTVYYEELDCIDEIIKGSTGKCVRAIYTINMEKPIIEVIELPDNLFEERIVCWNRNDVLEYNILTKKLSIEKCNEMISVLDGIKIDDIFDNTKLNGIISNFVEGER